MNFVQLCGGECWLCQCSWGCASIEWNLRGSSQSRGFKEENLAVLLSDRNCLWCGNIVGLWWRPGGSDLCGWRLQWEIMSFEIRSSFLPLLFINRVTVTYSHWTFYSPCIECGQSYKPSSSIAVEIRESLWQPLFWREKISNTVNSRYGIRNPI